jgi:triosephosphate isomerase (TIM)
MKEYIVAGNWKSNKSYLDAKGYVVKLNDYPPLDVKTILAVPAIYADTLFQLSKQKNVAIALQNASSYDDGAYTGEISAKMIASLAIPYCIVGHSERRKLLGETDEQIADKIDQLYLHKITPILCIGETMEERNTGETFNIIRRQLLKGVRSLISDSSFPIIIAYEPIWAIGTGITATEEQAGEVHEFIFQILSEVLGKEKAETIPLLYGGSCNEKNAEALFRQKHIWGGLIGGASLELDSFYNIMRIAAKCNA